MMSETKNNLENTTKFLNLKCKNCEAEITKTGVNKNLMTKLHDDSDFYKILPIYLKCFSLSSETKMNEKHIYLYEKVKCLNCGKKIGQLIKSAGEEMRNHLDNIIFNTENEMTIAETEINDETKIKEAEEKLRLSEKLFKSNNKTKILEFTSKNIVDVEERMLNIEAMLSKIYEDYDDTLTVVDDMKERLSVLFQNLKSIEKEENKEEKEEKEDKEVINNKIEVKKIESKIQSNNIQNSLNNYFKPSDPTNLKRKSQLDLETGSNSKSVKKKSSKFKFKI